MRIHITEKNGDIRNIIEGSRYDLFRNDGSFISEIRKVINKSLDEWCDIIISRDSEIKTIVLIRK